MGRHGENIRKRKDGRWEARFLAGYDSSGKAKYRYFYGKSYLEAKRKKQAAAAQRGASAQVNACERVTLRQAAREWLFQQRDSVKESTYAHYTDLVEQQILPYLGDCRMTELSGDLAERFFRFQLTQGRKDGMGGLAPKTVADLRSVLAQILDYAQSRSYLTVPIKLPTVPVRPPQISVLSRSEQKKLERLLFEEGSPSCLGILIALYAGLRIGEVCALQWGDFDMEEDTLHVCKTLIRIRDSAPNAPAKTKVLLQEPKTQCSVRTIPLPAFLSAYLKLHQKPANCYLLTGTERCLEPRSCLKQYKQILRRAGLNDYTFHTLRHTFATRCVENSFDIKSLSEIMGHSAVSITMQRYVHPSMDLKRQQMNRLTKM